MFKWICLASGLVVGLAIVGLLFSLSARAELALAQGNEALATVNENLPAVVEEARKTTHTLALLSEDVSALKELAGVQSDGLDRSFVRYADRLLDLLESEVGPQAQVGLGKLFGDDLKEIEPLDQFLVGVRREATLVVFRAKSKQEVLHRLTHNWSGKPFLLQLGGGDPVELERWLRARDQESSALPGFKD